MIKIENIISEKYSKILKNFLTNSIKYLTQLNLYNNKLNYHIHHVINTDFIFIYSI